MDVNLILPFISTAVMGVFTISVLSRWRARRKQHFLFWGIGLGMFTLGSFAESYFVIVGWSTLIFFTWYFFGAVLNAAYIGHGTFLLLVRKRWSRYVTAALVIASLIALVLMLQVMPRLDPTVFIAAAPISEQYQQIFPEISDGTTVRLTTPFFNIYGLITLVGERYGRHGCSCESAPCPTECWGTCSSRREPFRLGWPAPPHAWVKVATYIWVS